MPSEIPDAPIFTAKRDAVQESRPALLNTDTQDETRFVPQTLRAGTVVAATVTLLLAGTGHIAWATPFAAGAALGVVLIWSMDKVVRGAFGADTVLGERGVILPDAPPAQKKFGGKAALLLFALIKYPAVALLIFFVARRGTQTQILAFVGGFVCLQLVIGLRGLGAYLVPQKKSKA